MDILEEKFSCGVAKNEIDEEIRKGDALECVLIGNVFFVGFTILYHIFIKF